MNKRCVWLCVSVLSVQYYTEQLQVSATCCVKPNATKDSPVCLSNTLASFWVHSVPFVEHNICRPTKTASRSERNHSALYQTNAYTGIMTAGRCSGEHSDWPSTCAEQVVHWYSELRKVLHHTDSTVIWVSRLLMLLVLTVALFDESCSNRLREGECYDD
jgi:hypothetical protein